VFPPPPPPPTPPRPPEFSDEDEEEDRRLFEEPIGTVGFANPVATAGDIFAETFGFGAGARGDLRLLDEGLTEEDARRLDALGGPGGLF
jgi:hypothetical protein